MFKFKGQVIFDKPYAKFTLNPNWCNSMAEYYPYIIFTFIENNEIKMSASI